MDGRQECCAPQIPRQFGAGERVVFPHDPVERTGYLLPPSCTRESFSGSEGPPGCAPVHGPSPSTLSQGERVLKVLIYSICTAYLAPAFLRIVTWVLSPAWRFCSIRPSTCSVIVLWFGSTFFTVAVV